MAVWLLWVFSLATGRRRLLKYPTRPAFSFVLPSFPICCLLSLAAFRVSSSSAAEPFSFGSGAAPPLRCACGKVSHIDLSGLLFPCDSGTVRFSLSPFFFLLVVYSSRFSSFFSHTVPIPSSQRMGSCSCFTMKRNNLISFSGEKARQRASP